MARSREGRVGGPAERSKKGTLIVKATATDVAGNVSKPVAHKAVLTAS